MSSPRAATSVAMSRSVFPDAHAVHHRVALPLLHAAVQRLGAIAVRVERLDERIHGEPCPAEHDGRPRMLHVENAVERGRLLVAAHDIGDLAHARERARGALLGRDRHALRRPQVPLGDFQDAGGQRRREQRRLARGRRALDDLLDIVGEPHVEHLVRLVEHEHADPVETQCRAADVIECPARGGDDDMRATIESAELLLHGRAAVERDDDTPVPSAYL